MNKEIKIECVHKRLDDCPDCTTSTPETALRPMTKGEAELARHLDEFMNDDWEKEILHTEECMRGTGCSCDHHRLVHFFRSYIRQRVALTKEETIRGCLAVVFEDSPRWSDPYRQVHAVIASALTRLLVG